MTTIVRHRKTGNEYILLGINGDTSKTNPSRFISEFFAQEKAEVSYSATVCDAGGNLFLAYIDDLVVIEIDGHKPGELLPELEPVPPTRDVYAPPAREEGSFDDDFDSEFDEEFDDEEDLDSETESSNYTKTVDVVTPASASENSDRQTEDEEDWI